MFCPSIRLALVVPIVAVCGCASLIPSEPERPDYLGADEVTTVSPDMLTGLWDVTILNPIEDEANELDQVSFGEDGSYQGQFTVDEEEDGMPEDMTFRVTGRWSVSGESVVLSDGEVEAVDDEDGFGQMVTGFINRYMRDTDAELNVYEASEDHLVLVDEDGQARRYDRVR